jgi:hypothetical protein
MPRLPQVACQNFAGTPGKKGEGLAKNISSQGGGLALQFSQMKHPGLIWKTDFLNIHFPRGHFKRLS